jgi:phosphoserine aminotransferase
MRNAKLKINFNAGPGALPQEVLQQASQAVLEYDNTGLSILGVQHRGKHFDAILEESKALVKELCGLNDEYEVLWLHGGGRLQFSMIPMNFLDTNKEAGYIDSGFWASEAIEYANYYGNVNILSSTKADNYTHLPDWPTAVPQELAYVHFTTNNTIYGTQFKNIPAINTSLIADMSSDIFCKQRNYTNCDLFYAVAQKNIGPAGVTLVVIKKDLLQKQCRILPPMLSYTAHVKKNSVLNTPPVFAIYTSLLMLRWTKEKTIAAIENENNAKAAILYEEIERNPLFRSVVKEEDRSIMNACLRMNDETLQKEFIDFCNDNDVTGIAGHRTVGGLRVSLYNAITLQDVEHLVELMKAFEKQKA